MLNLGTILAKSFISQPLAISPEVARHWPSPDIDELGCASTQRAPGMVEAERLGNSRKPYQVFSKSQGFGDQLSRGWSDYKDSVTTLMVKIKFKFSFSYIIF